MGTRLSRAGAVTLLARSVLRSLSRSPRLTFAAIAATAAVALTAGVAATAPGNGRPLAMGLPAIASASHANGSAPLIGDVFTTQPAAGQPGHAASQPAGGGQAAGHQAVPSHHAPAGHHTTGHQTTGHQTTGHQTTGHGTTRGHTGHQGADKPRGAAAGKPAGHQQPATGHRHGKTHGHRSGTAAQHHKPAPVRHPYQMYDSVNPSSIPSHQPVAVYSTGRFYATPGQLHGLGKVMWIDITGRDYAASVLDVEPGDATPSQAGSWAWHRLHASPHAVARIYTNRTEWPAVHAAVNRLPASMRARVHWWIADPTGHPHIVAGASATQWYWGPNYDISKVQPGF